MMLRLFCITVTLLFACAGISAASSEGGIELNDAVAAAGLGAFDPPGYPIMIVDPGRYRLTGDLKPPSSDAAIDLMAPDVVIDFEGHQISGSGGSGAAGIRGFGGPAQRNIVFENGAILRMGGPGIELPDAEQVTLRAMRIIENTGAGFLLGRGAVVERTEVNANGECGGVTGENASVSDSHANGNQQCGFSVGAGSMLSRVQANDNMDSGVVFTDGGSASQVVASRNGMDGFTLTDESYGDPFPAMVELSEIAATGNEFGIKTESVRVKIEDAVIGGNRNTGIEATQSHVVLGSSILSENGGAGIYGYDSALNLSDVTLHDNGHMGFGSGVMVGGIEGGFSARALVAYGNYGAGVEIQGVDASLQDFTIRDNGKPTTMPGIWFDGGENTLTLQSGVLKNNEDAGLRCMLPSGVVFGDIKVFGNGGGAIVDCAKTETGPSHCGPAGAPGPC